MPNILQSSSSASTIEPRRTDRGAEVIYPPAFANKRFINSSITADCPNAPNWHGEAIDRICKLLELKVGWDSYKAKAIPFETGMFALMILNQVMRPSYPKPIIMPSPVGGIQLEWHSKTADLELHINKIYDSELWYEDRTGAEPIEESVVDDFSRLIKLLGIITNNDARGSEEKKCSMPAGE